MKCTNPFKSCVPHCNIADLIEHFSSAVLFYWISLISLPSFLGLLDTVPSDDDKQTLRNKLTWETTLLTSAQGFVSAALIVGLAERQTVDMNGR